MNITPDTITGVAAGAGIVLSLGVILFGINRLRPSKREQRAEAKLIKQPPIPENEVV